MGELPCVFRSTFLYLLGNLTLKGVLCTPLCSHADDPNELKTDVHCCSVGSWLCVCVRCWPSRGFVSECLALVGLIILHSLDLIKVSRSN